MMCDRKILSSDPSDWDELISEAAGAEKYSRRVDQSIRWARDTMIPSGPRTSAMRQMCSYSPMPPTRR